MMKALVKPLFLTTVLSTVSLCFTLSHAATILPGHKNPKTQIVVMTKLFSQKSSENINSNAQPVSYIQVFDKPLVRIPLSDTTHVEEQFQQTNKKNHFFEIATVFNDKLQQFIADISPDKEAELGTNGSTMLHANKNKNCKTK